MACCILAALIVGSAFRVMTWLRRMTGEADGGAIAIAACRSGGLVCSHRGAWRRQGFVAAVCLLAVAAPALFALGHDWVQAPAPYARPADSLAARIATLSIESICGKRASSVANAG